MLTEQQQIQTLLAKHPDMLKPFDKQVSDCIINFFIKISCPIVDQQQQPQAVQNEALSKRCLNLFQIAVSNDIWPNADIKLDFFDKILSTLEVNNNSTSGSVTNQSPQANSQVGGAQQQTNTTAQQPQTAQPNYSSICTVIEMVIFLVEHASGSLVKIQNIFRTIQRGMTACLMTSNSRVIRSMSNLIQKLMSILPSDIFNSNPNVASVSVAAVSALSQVTDKSTLTSTALVNSPGSLNNTSGDASHLDSIYQLFGQPDGKFCSTLFERVDKLIYKINIPFRYPFKYSKIYNSHFD